MQGLPSRKVAPELCYPEAAQGGADLSRQHSSDASTATGTPPGMSVDLGLGPAGLGLIQGSMSRELGGWGYSELWASAAMMQQQQQQQQQQQGAAAAAAGLSPPAYGSGGLGYVSTDALLPPYSSAGTRWI